MILYTDRNIYVTMCFNCYWFSRAIRAGLIQDLTHVVRPGMDIHSVEDINIRFVGACCNGDIDTVKSLMPQCIPMARQAIYHAYQFFPNSEIMGGQNPVKARNRLLILGVLIEYVDLDTMDMIFNHLLQHHPSQWEIILPILCSCLPRKKPDTWGESLSFALGNEFGNAFRFVAHECETVTRLDLSHNYNEIDLILKTFTKNKTLAHLELGSCKIDDSGVSVLAENPALTYLGLKRNKIKNPGINALARNITLTSIDLKENNITVQGMNALTKNMTLDHLEIWKDIFPHMNILRSRVTDIHGECIQLLDMFPDDLIQFVFAPHLFSPRIIKGMNSV